jgi:alkylation response protein AidB-like acyl-CoA dehydrogenase
MDFAFTDEQQAIADLAKQIFTDKASHQRQRQIERSGGPRFDRELWAELGKAGLLGIAIPQDFGGSGLGFLEVALIIEQVGRATAPVPFLETAVLGALPIAEFGSAEQRRTWLPRVASGDAVLTAALVEDDPEASRPATTARSNRGGGWRLSGRKICVPAGDVADCVLVPATLEDGSVGVFLVDPRAPGVRVESLVTTSDQPQALIVLDDAVVGAGERLGVDANGTMLVDWITERATAALAALAVGVCEQALALTSEYTKNRKQFDQPIAMFQAVGQRLADAYVDTEAIRLTAWQAAWRISAGLPAASQVAVAKFWASEGGQRVVHTAQHLHGGIGVDRDYPLHRYFLYAKQLELTLGGATSQLRRLGRMLADESL